MTEIDEVMADLGRAGARAALEALWVRVGDDGDPLHRCSIAHYCADLQDAVADELEWDRRALAAVGGLSDERARRFHDALQVRGFLPSLHVNLADAYRRHGEAGPARHHLQLAVRHLGVQPRYGGNRQ